MNDMSTPSTPSQQGSGPVIAAIIATKLALTKLVKDETNPFHRYKYVPIDTYYEIVASEAARHGLTWRTNILSIEHFIEQIENGKTQHILRFDFAVDLMHTSGMIWEGWQKLSIFHPTQGAQTTGSAMSYAEKLMMRTTFSVATSEDDVDAQTSSFKGNMRPAERAPAPVAPKRLGRPTKAAEPTPTPTPTPMPVRPVSPPPPPDEPANVPDIGQPEQPDPNWQPSGSGLSWTNFNEEPSLRSGEPRYDLDPLPQDQPDPEPAQTQPAITLPEGLAELSDTTGLPVISADRSAQNGRSEIIAHILTSFLPVALTEDELVAYWKDNHEALTTLKGIDLAAHNKIVLAFRDRRAEINAANADG